MPSYNKAILMGNLTRDPLLKYLPNGNPVTSFGIAMNEKYTDKQTGEDKETVVFVDVETWGKQAEVANEYLQKGDPVFIDGTLKYDSWENDEGEKRSKVMVRAFRIQFMKQRNGNGNENGYGNGYGNGNVDTPPQNNQTASASTNTDADDDGIPF